MPSPVHTHSMSDDDEACDAKYSASPLAGPSSHLFIKLHLSGADTLKLVQLNPLYPALALFRDGRFGMRLFLNGKRRFISSIKTWEIKAYSGEDTLFRVKCTGESTSMLGVRGERSNLLIFNSEPLLPNAVDEHGSGRSVMDAIDRLPMRFGTALAKGRVARESMLVLLHAAETVRDRTFADADRVAFCSCTASELRDGVWLFRLFRFEIGLVKNEV